MSRRPQKAPQRRPWYLVVLWTKDGPITAEHYFRTSVETHMGDEPPDPMPTRAEMSAVMHAAKMEMARQLAARRAKNAKKTSRSR